MHTGEMKTPICSVCVSSEILCAGCSGRLEQGEISNTDLSLARALNNLAQRFPALEKSEFKKTISFKDSIFVLVPKGTAGNLIGKGGVFIKELAASLNCRMKIIEETSDPKEMTEQIVFPARLLGINVVYSGKKQAYKIRIPNSDRNKIFHQSALESLIRKMIGGKANIIFE